MTPQIFFGFLIFIIVVICAIAGFVFLFGRLIGYIDGRYGRRKAMPDVFVVVSNLLAERKGWQAVSNHKLRHSSALTISWNNDKFIKINVPDVGDFGEYATRLRGGEHLITACETLRAILALQFLDGKLQPSLPTGKRRTVTDYD